MKHYYSITGDAPNPAGATDPAKKSLFFGKNFREVQPTDFASNMRRSSDHAVPSKKEELVNTKDSRYDFVKQQLKDMQNRLHLENEHRELALQKKSELEAETRRLHQEVAALHKNLNSPKNDETSTCVDSSSKHPEDFEVFRSFVRLF